MQWHLCANSPHLQSVSVQRAMAIIVNAKRGNLKTANLNIENILQRETNEISQQFVLFVSL